MGRSESTGGGSTITQQLAKMLFPRENLNRFSLIFRKFKEWVIAVKLEKNYTKDEIIAMYLNKFDFINNAVGIRSASAVYFSTTPDSLKYEEAAMSVGMAKNPSLFSPIRHPKRALERRNTVLAQMEKYKYKQYTCECCCFSCIFESDYKRHMKTKKHMKIKLKCTVEKPENKTIKLKCK